MPNWSNIRITGVDKTIQAMKKMKSHDGRNLKRGIQSCLQVILRKAQFYVPKDTLALLNSGEVIFLPGVGLNAKGYIHFGGPSAPYAFIVHERPATHEPPTKMLYLSSAVNDTRGTCVSILRRQMRVSST